MKKLFIFLSFAALVLAGAGCSFEGGENINESNANLSPEPVACTMEAKLCPDGSAVGRVGPDCEFAPCPGESKATINFLVSAEDKLKYCNGADMASEEFGKTITKTMTKEISGADLSRNELIRQSIIAASEEENLKTVIDQGNDFLKIVGDTAYLAPTDGWAGVSIFLCAWKPLVEVNLLNFSEIKNIVWVENREKWQELVPALSEAEAKTIAEATCIKGGEALGEGSYNENTKTWWFDANLNATREGCNPACVVSVESKTAEINWRCTGLILPEGNN